MNPNWLDDEQWQVNCTRCSAAVEMRARGYDVTAGPKPEDVDDNTIDDVRRMWRDGDGEHPDWDWQESGDLDAILLQQGEGARGFVINFWTDGGGHIFNYEIRNGKVQYIDGQPNQPNKGNSWKDRSEPGVALIRTDNLTPEKDIGRWTPRREDD